MDYSSSNGIQNLTHMFKVFHSRQSQQHLGSWPQKATSRTDWLEWSVIKTLNLPSFSLEARSYAQYSVITPWALPSRKNRHLFSKLVYFGALQFFLSFWLSTYQKVFARHPMSVLLYMHLDRYIKYRVHPYCNYTPKFNLIWGGFIRTHVKHSKKFPSAFGNFQ